MFKRAPKTVVAIILLLAAWEMMRPSHYVQAARTPASQPLVRAISVRSAPNGASIIDIALTQPVPYRTLQLSSPGRLVVDLKGAHEADLRNEYSAPSEVLKRVRVSQWKYDPAVVRVVVDLKGKPSFSVTKQTSGIRIELKPHAVAQSPDYDSGYRNGRSAANAADRMGQTARDDPPPKTVFPVHRFKDLSASLTAPALPPDDHLVPITTPGLAPIRHEKSGTLATVSGISIKPASRGVMYVDIASTRSVPYRVFQLTHPFRLVIDLKNARDASKRNFYRIDSPVVKSIRVDQWRPGPSPVVRVVADLRGYPVFDVHAQRPGIHIEIRPRQTIGPGFRNPFAFAFRTAGPTKQTPHPSAGTVPAAVTTADSRLAAPGNAFSDLKVIGFIEKKDSGVQAVISDHSNLYFVPKGGTFEKIFTVVEISPNGVEIQKLQTSEKAWLAYAP